MAFLWFLNVFYDIVCFGKRRKALWRLGVRCSGQCVNYFSKKSNNFQSWCLGNKKKKKKQGSTINGNVLKCLILLQDMTWNVHFIKGEHQSVAFHTCFRWAHSHSSTHLSITSGLQAWHAPQVSHCCSRVFDDVLQQPLSMLKVGITVSFYDDTVVRYIIQI